MFAWADEADTLRLAAYEHLALGRTDAGREALRKYLKKFPESQHAPDIALALGVSYTGSDEDMGTRTRQLRQVAKTYKVTRAGRRAQELLDHDRNLRRAKTPTTTVLPSVSPAKFIKIARRGGGLSRYVVYRLDPKGLRSKLLAVPFADLRLDDLVGGNFSHLRRRIADVEIDFPHPEQNIEADFGVDGTYVIAENTLGNRKLHRVTVERSGIYIKVLGGEAVGYVDSAETLHLRTKNATTQREVSGLFRFPVREPTWVFVRSSAYRLEPGEPAAHERVHIATDRPIYRPGQTVRFRAIRRGWNAKGVTLPAPGDVSVEVRDPTGRVMQRSQKRWSDLGTLTGSFVLAPEPPMGEYTILVHVPRPEDDKWLWWEDEEPPDVWFQSFTVAAYRKPEMTVRVEIGDATPVVGKRKVKARIVAEYLFGGPVKDAKVNWEVTRPGTAWDDEMITPYWAVPFPERDGWWRHLFDAEREGPEEHYDAFVDGEGRTNKDGVCEIEFLAEPNLTDTDAPRNFSFVVRAHVIDRSDKVAEGVARLRAAAAPWEVRVGADRMWYSPGDEALATVQVTDLHGDPVANKPVDLNVFQDDEGDWVEWESVFRRELTTDQDGFATCKVPLEHGGDARLRARVGTATARAEFIVKGPRSDFADQLIPDRLVYRPGDTIEVLVNQWDGTEAILTVEGDVFHEVRLIKMKGSAKVIRLKAKASWAPAPVIKLFNVDTGDSCGCEIYILPAHLDVTVATDKPVYKPGEDATVTITAAPGAEIELGIVDEGIFELRPDTTDHILSFFHPLPRHNLSLFGTYAEMDDDWRNYRYDPGDWSEVPLFGGQSEEAPKALAGPVHVRRSFPDTLFWSGTVRADEDGRAVVSIPGADSLTRWRIVARAVAGKDRFGVGRSLMLTRKRVVVRLAAPRFLTVGDECSVGVIVHNGLDQPHVFRIRGESVEVPAGGEHRLDWTVRAEKVGTLTLKADAMSAVESDAIEVTIPVLPRTVELVKHHAAQVGVEAWSQQVGPGQLDLVVTGSGGAVVREALPFLAGYPYGCVEQTMSRFLPATVGLHALEKAKLPPGALAKDLPDMIDRGLQRLYGFQHDDGGWGWWKDDDTDPFMTAYVVYGLVTARGAGVPVDPRTLKSGVAALVAIEKDKPTAFGAYALTLFGVKVKAPQAQSVEDRAYLMLAGERGMELPADPPATGSPQDVRRTALIIRALAAANGADERIGPLVDWLLEQRRGGAWHSTLDTAYAVLALSSLDLGRSGPPPTTISLDGKRVKPGRFVLDRAVQLRVSGQGAFVSATVRTRGEGKPRRNAWFTVQRQFLRKGAGKDKWVPIKAGDTVRAGEMLRMAVTLDVKRDSVYMMVVAPLPAGMEAVEPSEEERMDAWWGRLSVRDDRVEIAYANAWKHRHTASIRVRATNRGRFVALPPFAFAMYNPDRLARGSAFLMTIK